MSDKKIKIGSNVQSNIVENNTTKKMKKIVINESQNSDTTKKIKKIGNDEPQNSNVEGNISIKAPIKEENNGEKIDYKEFFNTDEKKSKKGKVIPLVLVVVALVLFYAYNNINKNSQASNDTSTIEQVETNNEENNTNESTENIEENNQNEEIYSEEVEEENSIIDINAANNNSTDYLFSDSSTRFIEESELSQYTKEELAYIRNEIYARKGYVFNLDKYKNYFENKDWYVPNVNVKDDLSDLNTYERENVKLILELENR